MGRDETIIYDKGRLPVRFAKLEGGRCPGKEFYDGLEAGTKADLVAICREIGNGRRLGTARMRQLDKEIYELKIHNPACRFYCAFCEQAVIITHGRKKPPGRAEVNKAVAKARKILGRHVNEEKDVRQDDL
jgi:hypothetical protein